MDRQERGAVLICLGPVVSDLRLQGGYGSKGGTQMAVTPFSALLLDS